LIACLNVPFFASAVERRANRDSATVSPSRPGLQGQPGLVIGGQPWEPQAVYAYSREAAQQGVRPGMSLRLAHFLSPRAQFMPADPPLYQGASAEIVDILTGFTHLVEPELFWSQAGVQVKNGYAAKGAATSGSSTLGSQILQAGSGPAFGHRLPARYTLDLESLPPTEALSLAQEIGRTVRSQAHLAPAIGLAQNHFVAHVAAVYTQANYARPILPDQVAPFLSTCSIRFLALDNETTRRLSLLGIRTLGQLVSLPLSSAGLRLGLDGPSRKALATLYQMITNPSETELNSAASAHLLPPIRPHRPEKSEQLAYHFDPPLADRLVLEQALTQAATRLAGRLAEAGLEGRTLHLSLQADSQVFETPSITGQPMPTAASHSQLSRRQPSADPGQLAGSLRELLHQALTVRASDQQGPAQAAQPPAYTGFSSGSTAFEVGLTALEIRVADLTPAVTAQLTLFEPPRSGGKLEEILPNLFGKYESALFLRPELTDAHHPLAERRFHLAELAAS
jgi:nucleotidyltransferase/DNA polymerase involved in DNA repair